MSITPRLSFFRNNVLALLAISSIGGLVGCSSSDTTTANKNIELTDSFKVEYVPDEMEPTMGKAMFQVRVTDRISKEAASNETIKLMPLMHMNTGVNHATPVDNNGNCNESATAGTYDCTLFYVMADVDALGGSVGDWELEILVGGMGGESAKFSPSVGINPDGIPMMVLRNENLTANSMNGVVARPFQNFKSELTGFTGNHTFELFTSAMETMMSFPAINAATTLNDTFDITSMTVKVSTDSTFAADVSVASNDTSSGYWTAEAITGLTDGVEAQLYVQVTINGFVMKSSPDGVAGNEYATFTVTP